MTYTVITTSTTKRRYVIDVDSSDEAREIVEQVIDGAEDERVEFIDVDEPHGEEITEVY